MATQREPAGTGAGKRDPDGEARQAMTAIMESDVLETESALTGRELTAWLESPEGETWSQASHLHASRHSHGVFAEVKDDHPSMCPGDGSDIETANRWGLEILMEITWYGMNGVPNEPTWHDNGP